MTHSEPQQSFVPALLRAFWMLLGNGAVLIIALTIARLEPWTLSWRDIVFWCCVGCVLYSRWVDATRYGGTTADGEPMTRSMLVRYAVMLLGASTGLWIVAQSIGF